MKQDIRRLDISMNYFLFVQVLAGLNQILKKSYVQMVIDEPLPSDFFFEIAE